MSVLTFITTCFQKHLVLFLFCCFIVILYFLWQNFLGHAIGKRKGGKNQGLSSLTSFICFWVTELLGHWESRGVQFQIIWDYQTQESYVRICLAVTVFKICSLTTVFGAFYHLSFLPRPFITDFTENKNTFCVA